MVTESFTHAHPTTRVEVLASRALAADLAVDPADLLDLSTALGLEFHTVIEALLRAPDRPAPAVIRALGMPSRAQPTLPSGEPAPFVWVGVGPPGRRRRRTVRAGWLIPAAVDAIAAEARAAGAGTAVQIIVPLDGGDGTAARVHALCAGFPPDLTVTIDVQRDRAAEVRSRTGTGFRTGTWIVLDPIGAPS